MIELPTNIMEMIQVLLFFTGLLVIVFGAVPELQITQTVEGNCSAAQARDGNFLTVDYEGTFDNGTVFDSSFARNESFKFTLGDPRLTKGWNMALQGACVNDELQLKIPYSLAYGEDGRPPIIPPRTDLNFWVHVLAIDDVNLSLTGNGAADGFMTNATDSTSDMDDDDDDTEGNPEPFDPSGLLYKLQFLAIPVAVILFILVAYCIYTVEYPDRKIKFYRVSDHESDGGLNRVV
ncbi:FK506-binding protein 2-like [Acanthaster planci]|uniref:peptidylprolyl isomerase n=1 Tax=Acanthaster planci TaxID=133434 RepID=A0A8B7ZLB6_ACAPL|nr:FK506-binding protein 2-like [Acanthaster planci]